MVEKQLIIIIEFEVEHVENKIDFKNHNRFFQLGITISIFRKMRKMSQEQLTAESMMNCSHLSVIEALNIVMPFSAEVFLMLPIR